jgi:hypothetical protein
MFLTGRASVSRSFSLDDLDFERRTRCQNWLFDDFRILAEQAGVARR